MLCKFVDVNGVLWQVWDVKPTHTFLDRRRNRRRKQVPLDYSGPERRISDKRRRSADAGEQVGWLAFDSKVGRKRLMGIPTGWGGDVTDAQLQEWCSKARDVSPTLEWKDLPDV